MFAQTIKSEASQTALLFFKAIFFLLTFLALDWPGIAKVTVLTQSMRYFDKWFIWRFPKIKCLHTHLTGGKNFQNNRCILFLC